MILRVEARFHLLCLEKPWQGSASRGYLVTTFGLLRYITNFILVTFLNNVWPISKRTWWSEYKHWLSKCIGVSELEIESRESQLADYSLPSSSNSSQPPPSGGKSTSSLFGSLGTSQPHSSQPQQTSSLFGNTSQPQRSGGLFGFSTGNNHQQGSNMFGGGQNNQSTGGGVFGSQQDQERIGGESFGSSTAQQSQPQQGGGLFASLGQNQAQIKPQQPQNSLFSGLNNQNKTSSLLFVLPCSLASFYLVHPSIWELILR